MPAPRPLIVSNGMLSLTSQREIIQGEMGVSRECLRLESPNGCIMFYIIYHQYFTNRQRHN